MTKVDRMARIKLKWTKVEKMDRSKQNSTNIDRIEPIWTEWTK